MPVDILIHIRIRGAGQVVNLVHRVLTPLKELITADLPLGVAHGGEALHFVDCGTDIIGRDGDVRGGDVCDGRKAALHLKSGGQNSLQMGGRR